MWPISVLWWSLPTTTTTGAHWEQNCNNSDNRQGSLTLSMMMLTLTILHFMKKSGIIKYWESETGPQPPTPSTYYNVNVCDVCQWLDTSCSIMIAWMWVKSLSYECPPYCYLFALRKERRDSGGEWGVEEYKSILMMKSKITEITAKMLQMVIITSPSAEFYRELDLSVLTSTPPHHHHHLHHHISPHL